MATTSSSPPGSPRLLWRRATPGSPGGIPGAGGRARQLARSGVEADVDVVHVVGGGRSTVLHGLPAGAADDVDPLLPDDVLDVEAGGVVDHVLRDGVAHGGVAVDHEVGGELLGRGVTGPGVDRR